MEQICEQQLRNTRSRSTSRLKKHSAKADMTPMVDLGFLLIAFFVMTTELSRPTVTNLIMPKEGGHPSALGESTALTLLIGSDKMYYYVGDKEKAWANNQIHETSFSLKDGIGAIIRERQAVLGLPGAISKEGRLGLMLLIKPGPDANYSQIIDAIDETQINGVKKYALLSPDNEELDLLRSSH